MSKFFDLVIRWSFYLLFFLVPLVFYSNSHELFEYNKMMLTYGLTIIIASAWVCKMVSEGRIIWRRTFLDLPLLFYLASHIISTVFSIDTHTSIWGYYSRFHEGLLATISYIILYYALVSNLSKKDAIVNFCFSLASAGFVSLWGIAEHFGVSLSCAFITHKLDVDCWIQDVKNRVFATLGQPNWMAAYLDVLILTAFGLILNINYEISNIRENLKPQTSNLKPFLWILTPLLFSALLFTKSRSGILGLFAGLAVFSAAILYVYRGNAVIFLRDKFLLSLLVSLALLVLFFGLPFDKIDQFTIPNLLAPKKQAVVQTKPKTNDGYIDIGISESGDIRKIVWKGALKVWERYPVFGSGVETFAFAYYKDRPIEHNNVSEWDFLYNKAHNEFLNILATTGSVGFLSYLSILGVFSWWVFKKISSQTQSLITNHQSIVSPASPAGGLPTSHSPLVLALYSAYISILVTNFFGFSVVVIGIYFFLIPGLCFLLLDVDRRSGEPPDGGDSRISKSETLRDPGLARMTQNTTTGQWVGVGLIIIAGSILLLNLVTMWQADKDFAFGKNLDGVQMYAQATPYLVSAVEKNNDEPLYKDELSYNEAILTALLNEEASGSAEEKIKLVAPYLNVTIKSSNDAVTAQPNNLSFWKTRTKVFYQLSAINPQYMVQALNAIAKAIELAPTDPKVHYNYGFILSKLGQTSDAIKAFEETIRLKPDYSDAHYALGQYYAQLGQKDLARAQMEFILKKIGPDEKVSKWLEENK